MLYCKDFEQGLRRLLDRMYQNPLITGQMLKRVLLKRANLADSSRLRGSGPASVVALLRQVSRTICKDWMENWQDDDDDDDDIKGMPPRLWPPFMCCAVLQGLRSTAQAVQIDEDEDEDFEEERCMK